MNKATLLYADITLLKRICNKLGIDINIYYYTSSDPAINNIAVASKDDKITMVEKILNIIPRSPTLYSRRVVMYEDLYGVIDRNSYVLFGSFYSTNPSVFLLMSELGMKFNQISFYLARESWATDRPITYNQLSVLYNEALISKPSRMDEGCHYNRQQKSGGSSSWVSDKNTALKLIKEYYKL